MTQHAKFERCVKKTGNPRDSALAAQYISRVQR